LTALIRPEISDTEGRIMLSSDELKSQLRKLFDASVPNPGDYNVVYSSSVKQKNYIFFQRTIVSSYLVGYRRDPAELVVLPFDVEDLSSAGSPTVINAGNKKSNKRSLQGYRVVQTTGGEKFALGVFPGGLPKPLAMLMDAMYQLPIEQKADAEDFLEFIKGF
jgi:hypothetical protein